MKSILKWIKSVKEKSFKILELVTRPENDLNCGYYNKYLNKNKKFKPLKIEPLA